MVSVSQNFNFQNFNLLLTVSRSQNFNLLLIVSGSQDLNLPFHDLRISEPQIFNLGSQNFNLLFIVSGCQNFNLPFIIGDYIIQLSDHTISIYQWWFREATFRLPTVSISIYHRKQKNCKLNCSITVKNACLRRTNIKTRSQQCIIISFI